jgi:hypothetical protein
VAGDKLPLGSFPTAEAAARAYDACAAPHPERPLNFPAEHARGSASASRQPAALTLVIGPPPSQRDGADECGGSELRDSAEAGGDDGGGSVLSAEQAWRGTAPGSTAPPAYGNKLKADCMQYVGVSYMQRRTVNPYRAQICYMNRGHTICYSATAKQAALAYDAIASTIPGRKLNFPTATSLVMANGMLRSGAVGAPAEATVIASIAAYRATQTTAQPSPHARGPRGEIKYLGVSMNNGSYKAEISSGGQRQHLGSHPTAEDAARAYDAVACTIPGRALNFSSGGSSAAAARDAPANARLLPTPLEPHAAFSTSAARDASPHDADDDVAPAADPHTRKRKRKPSSQLSAAREASRLDDDDDIPAADPHARASKGKSSSQPRRAEAAQRHRSKQPAKPSPPRGTARRRQSGARAHAPLPPMTWVPPTAESVDALQRRTTLELFLAGVDEDGEPLNGASQVGLPDLTVAELLALQMKRGA